MAVNPAAFTKENAAEMARRGLEVKRQRRKARQKYLFPPASPFEDAHERSIRFWGIVAAIDKRLTMELERERPNGDLMRDLVAARKGLLSQADGPQPTNGKYPDHKPQPSLMHELPQPVEPTGES